MILRNNYNLESYTNSIYQINIKCSKNHIKNKKLICVQGI